MHLHSFIHRKGIQHSPSCFQPLIFILAVQTSFNFNSIFFSFALLLPLSASFIQNIHINFVYLVSWISWAAIERNCSNRYMYILKSSRKRWMWWYPFIYGIRSCAQQHSLFTLRKHIWLDIFCVCRPSKYVCVWVCIGCRRACGIKNSPYAVYMHMHRQHRQCSQTWLKLKRWWLAMAANIEIISAK